MKTNINSREIFISIGFIFYVIDRHIEGDNTDYMEWIVIFFTWIAFNTANIKK